MSPKKPRIPKVRPVDPFAVDSTWRLFLAVLPPEPVLVSAGALLAELEAEGWPVRWSSPESLHVTLQFLGEQPRERAELLRLALPPVVAAHEAFSLRTGDLGIFPSIRYPRIIWLGLNGPAHRLITLHGAIGEVLRELDYPAETQPFHPHITLGRARNTGTPTVPLRALPDVIRRRFANPATGVLAGPPPEAVPVREVVLMRSILSHEGSRYDVVARFPLAPPAEN